MSTRALLFIGPPERADDPFEHPTLASPLGRETVLTRYCRLIAARCQVTKLIVPESLVELLPTERICGLDVHTYRDVFGDGTFGQMDTIARTTFTLLVNVEALPWIDLAGALAVHRCGGGAGMTVFCGPAPVADPCSEDLDGYSFHERPLAIILSRRTFRADPSIPIGDFVELTHHLRERMHRAGDWVRYIRHASVRGHAEIGRAGDGVSRTGNSESAVSIAGALCT